MLQTCEITLTELINPIREGGRKRQDIADMLGVSRSTANSVSDTILSEISAQCSELLPHEASVHLKATWGIEMSESEFAKLVPDK